MPQAPVKFGYLLPTRERIMAGEHETRSVLTLAREAEAMEATPEEAAAA